MAKRKVPLGSRSIADMITAGVKIQGKKAFLQVDCNGQELFVPVIINGFSLSTDTCSINIEVSIQAMPEEAAVYVRVTPCQLYMTMLEITHMQARRKVMDAAMSAWRDIGCFSLLRRKAAAFEAWAHDNKQIDVLMQELAALNRKLNNLCSTELFGLAKDMFIAHYELTKEEVNEINWTWYAR